MAHTWKRPTLKSPGQAASRAPRTPQTRRVLNRPLLIATVLVLAVGGPALYLRHEQQVGSTARAFLDRAAALEADDQLDEAASSLHNYLRLHPEDGEAWGRLAETYDRSPQGKLNPLRSIELHLRAIGMAPERSDLRGRLAELLLEVGRFSEAEQQASQLDDSAIGKRVAALALYEQAQSGGIVSVERALTAIREAIESDPGNVALALAAANIYRERSPDMPADERARLADAAIDRMVSTDPSNANAILARYRYRAWYELDGVDDDDDLAAAVKLDPENLEVLLASGRFHLHKGVKFIKDGQTGAANDHFLQAASNFKQVTEIGPTDGGGYLGLGNVLLAQGKSRLAVEAFQSGTRQASKSRLELLAKLADVLTTMNRLDEVEPLLESLEQMADGLSQRLASAEMAAVRNHISFLRARWLFARNEHFKAIPILRQIAVTQKAVRDSRQGVVRHAQTWMMLGVAYASQRYWDQAANAHEQAVAVDPGNAEAHLAAAMMWDRAGRLESAIQNFKRAFRLDPSLTKKQPWLHYIKIRIQLERSAPAGGGNWQEIESDLTNAPTELHEEWRFPLLQAVMLFLQPSAGDDDPAAHVNSKKSLALLQQAEKKFSDSIPLLQRLVLTYQYMDETAASDRVLAKVQVLAPDDVETKLVASELLALRQDYAGAQELLRRTIVDRSPSQQFVLRSKMVELNQRAGETNQARDELLVLHKNYPDQLEIVRQLAMLALVERDDGDLERWDTELERIEGPEGSLWRYFRALRLLLGQPTKAQDPRLIAAADLQRQIESQRPSWPLAQLLKGTIASRQGNHQQAIDALEEAIRLGEKGTHVLEQLIVLLYQTNRIADAQKYLLRLRKQVQSSERLLPVSVSVATRLDDSRGATELALAAVTRRPQDAIARMWLGHTLALEKDKQQEAEATFLKAVELAPKDVRTWSGLFSFYVGQRRKEDAKKTLDNLAQQVKLSPLRRAFVLAQGYEMLGDVAQATKHYEKARRLGPDDVPIQLRVASFQFRRDPAESETILRKILKLKPDSDAARRSLAAILASRGGESAWNEVMQLLTKTSSSGEVAQLDRRLQALLLSRRGHLNGGGESDRIRARKILEDLVRDPGTAVGGDRLLLARLYDAEGKYQAARDQYDVLVSRNKPSASHLAWYVDLALRRSKDDRTQIGVAAALLRRLERIDPGSMSTVLLQARLMERQGTASVKAIDQLAKPFVDQINKVGNDKKLTADEKTANKSRLLAYLGRLYSGVKLYESAENWNRQLMQVSATAYGPLAGSLAAQSRFKEAIALYREKAEKGNSAVAIVAAASVLAAANAPAEQMQGMDPMIELALKDHKKNVHVLFSVAVLYTMQHRHDEAIFWFRKVHEIRPQDILTLNNLATLLSEIPEGREEALQFIRKAIALAGREAPLLDTMGMTLLHNGQTKQALQLLEEASSASTMINVDPRYHFHRAVALLRLGELEQARAALGAADARELEGQILTDVERGLLTDLRQKLVGKVTTQPGS